MRIPDSSCSSHWVSGHSDWRLFLHTGEHSESGRQNLPGRQGNVLIPGETPWNVFGAVPGKEQGERYRYVLQIKGRERLWPQSLAEASATVLNRAVRVRLRIRRRA